MAPMQPMAPAAGLQPTLVLPHVSSLLRHVQLSLRNLLRMRAVCSTGGGLQHMRVDMRDVHVVATLLGVLVHARTVAVRSGR